jgi:hypothetical protein
LREALYPKKIISVFKVSYEQANNFLFASAQKSKQILKNMNEEPDGISIESILREATTVLQAARQHAAELSEVGLTDHELDRMRVLITHVAAHSFTSLWSNINVAAEVNELKIVKEVIFRAAEMRFGQSHQVLSEFKYTAQRKTVV